MFVAGLIMFPVHSYITAAAVILHYCEALDEYPVFMVRLHKVVPRRHH